MEINGSLAPLLYADTEQINFQVPCDLSSGTASLTVHAPGGDTSAFAFTVVAQTPSIFQYGTNHAVAQNNDAKHSLNSSTAPAAAGSVITVYLTGQGPLDNSVACGSKAPDSPLSNATATATATIQGKSAAVQFLGLTPGFAGLAQANIKVPTLPTGDYPLVLTVGGTMSTSAVVSVSGTGTAYTGPLTLIASAAFSNTSISNISLLGNTAYVCSANRITMVDVSDPTSPSVVGEFGDSTLNGNGTICVINTQTGSPYLVDVVGPLNNPVSFATYDLSSPRSPRLLGLTATQYPYIVDLSFNGVYGYASTSYFTYQTTSSRPIIAQTGDFLSFDFTSPGSPVFLSVLSTLSNAHLKPSARVVSQAYAYIASSTATGGSTAGTGTIEVIGVGTPAGMYSANEVSVSPSAIIQSFDVENTLLLASGNTTGNRNPGNPDFDFTGNLTLTTMDLTNITSPTVLASFDTGLQVNGTFYTVAFNNGVFAIVCNPPATDNGGPASLMVVDARQPSNPVLYPFQTQFGFSDLVPTSAGYLLAPTSFGLNIYLLNWQ